MSELDISPETGKARARRFYKTEKGLGFNHRKHVCPVCKKSLCKCSDMRRREKIKYGVTQ
nr:hypothetical protein [uncultured Methanolobus sp.]